jgi:hypothetical protein
MTSFTQQIAKKILKLTVAGILFEDCLVFSTIIFQQSDLKPGNPMEESN